MGNTRVNFWLPEELVEKADVAAEISKENRMSWNGSQNLTNKVSWTSYSSLDRSDLQ